MRIASSICSSCILSSTHFFFCFTSWQLVLSLFNFNWIGASFWFYWIYLQFAEPRINVMLMENYIDAACSLFFLAQWQLALPLYNFKWVDASFFSFLFFLFFFSLLKSSTNFGAKDKSNVYRKLYRCNM